MPLTPLGADWAPRLESVAASLLLPQHSLVMARFVEVVPTLCKYLDLLVQWNQRLDLTAARSADELVDLTLADAAVLAMHTPVGSGVVVDVGSGAGAPALPFVMLCPDLALTLVEPKAKRVAFLRTASAALGLTNISVVRSRSDALPGACCATAISRATLSPELWLAEGARLATQRVWVLLGRGQAPHLRGWQRVAEREYQLPLTLAMRRALCYEPDP